MANSSLQFSLSGFALSPALSALIFALTLMWYLLILAGNSAIVVIVITDRALHAPMYVFLCNLCLNALYGTLGFYPKFLSDLLLCATHAPCWPTVNYGSCMLQGFVIHSYVCGDFSTLALMAYDRYVAICRPLSYRAFMSRARVGGLLLVSWLVPLLAMFMNTVTLVGRQLCGTQIRRIYCVNWMVRMLLCVPPMENAAVGYFNIVFFFCVFLFVVWTYLRLVRTCQGSRESTQRFMQTVVPHLVSLVTFTFSVLLDLLYMRFAVAALPQHAANFFALEFLLVPPLVNPLIYGLKLHKIRHALLGRRGVGKGSSKVGPKGGTGPTREQLD